MRPVLRICGSVLSCISVVVLLLTVGSLPWMLGGVIPLARLVLLVGAVAAATLSILGNLFTGRLPSAVPAVMLPLALLALLGTLQLRSASESPAAQMAHAVHEPVLASSVVNPTHTLSPADTRSTIGTLLALSLVACVAFDQFRSNWTIAAGCLVFIINGLAITTIGMTNLFQQQAFFLNENWTLSTPGASAFASFVNTNNAAGWLCLCVAVAAGWIAWHLTPTGATPVLRRGRLKISIAGRLWQNAVEFVAQLTAWKIIALAGIALMGAGVAATRSRGGILAMLVAAVLTGCMRSSMRRQPLVILLLVVCAAATFGTLQWLDLDAAVVGEMETLKDLDQAASVRPQLWFDSLQVLRDFPAFGTGLGSYRFANLPYQTEYASVWYRNGDNHFVDVAVEGGLIGLLLFVTIGICGLFTGRAAWRQSKSRTLNRDRETPRVSRRILAGLGTTAVLATLSQAISGFFDFGVGLPAASALLVVLIAATAGFLAGAVVTPGLKTAGSTRTGLWFTSGLHMGLIIGGASLIPDQFFAVKIDEVVVAGQRLLASPIDAAKLNQLNATRKELSGRLASRPDDPEARRLETLLADADFRWTFLQIASEDELTDDVQISRLWNANTAVTLVERLWQLQRQAPTAAPALRQQLRELMQQVELPLALERAQQRFPLMPKIASERAVLAVLTQDAQTFQRQASTSLFCEPASASNQFMLGSIALRIGQPELTQRLWQHSLELTDRFRASILAEASNHWSAAEGLELFGPRDYAASVRAASSSRDTEQRQELYKRADGFWEQVKQPADLETSRARVTHLLAVQQHDEARAWLATSLKTHSDDTTLRTHYAKLLEQDGRFLEALDEWYRIQYADRGNAKAEASIKRIRRLKSAPAKKNHAVGNPVPLLPLLRILMQSVLSLFMCRANSDQVTRFRKLLQAFIRFLWAPLHSSPVKIWLQQRRTTE